MAGIGDDLIRAVARGVWRVAGEALCRTSSWMVACPPAIVVFDAVANRGADGISAEELEDGCCAQRHLRDENFPIDVLDFPRPTEQEVSEDAASSWPSSRLIRWEASRIRSASLTTTALSLNAVYRPRARRLQDASGRHERQLAYKYGVLASESCGGCDMIFGAMASATSVRLLPVRWRTPSGFRRARSDAGAAYSPCSFPKQLDILRAYAALGANGQLVGIQSVAEVVNLKPEMLRRFLARFLWTQA